MGYSKAPEQPQSSPRPICHSHAMRRTGREPATMRIAALELATLHTAPLQSSGLMFDLVMCKFGKGMVIDDTECRY